MSDTTVTGGQESASGGGARAETSGGSIRTVVIAFVANLLVAVAKTIAAFVTGSASMVAESAHSWADAGNEIFLLIAERRSVKKIDGSHPRGYGREAYVWSLFAAVGLFTAGAVVSIQHGIQELSNPEESSDQIVAYIVLAIAFVLEGFSFVQSYLQARKTAEARGMGTLHHVLGTSNTTLRAVFAEDAAALIGLVIAFLGVFLHQITGNAVFDAVGSILVGVLLAIVALVLIDRNRRFLVGEPASADVRRRIVGLLLERDDVERVTYLHLEFVGPERFFLVASIDLTGNDREVDVARELRRIATDLEQSPYIADAVLTLSTPDEASLTA